MVVWLAVSSGWASTCDANDWCTDIVMSESTSGTVLKVPVGAAVRHHEGSVYSPVNVAYIATDVDTFTSNVHTENELWGLKWSCSNNACTSGTQSIAPVQLAATTNANDLSTIPSLVIQEDPKNGTLPHFSAQEDDSGCSPAQPGLHEYIYNAGLTSLLDNEEISGSGLSPAVCKTYGHDILTTDDGFYHVGWTEKGSTTEHAKWALRTGATGAWDAPVALPEPNTTQSDHVSIGFTSGHVARILYHEHNNAANSFDLDFVNPEDAMLPVQTIVAANSSVDWDAVWNNSGTWIAVARTQSGTTATFNARSCTTNCTSTGTWSTISNFTFNRSGVGFVRDVEFGILPGGRRILLWAEQPSGTSGIEVWVADRCPADTSGVWNQARVYTPAVGDPDIQLADVGRPHMDFDEAHSVVHVVVANLDAWTSPSNHSEGASDLVWARKQFGGCP